MRKIILVALALLILFVYHVLSDRYTPYTSQARVETFLTQVAPEVAGDVLEVGVKDNMARSRRASCCSASTPNPINSRSVGRGQPRRCAAGRRRFRRRCRRGPRADRQAARRPVRQPQAQQDRHGPRRQERARAKRRKSRSTPISARRRPTCACPGGSAQGRSQLGRPGLRNPKVRQALAALDQARLDLATREVVAPADGTVTNLRLAAGQYVAPGQPLLSFLEAVRGGFPPTCGRTSWAMCSRARM